MFEVFTDSASNLSAVPEERGIHILPLSCTLGDREIRPESFDAGEFYAALRRGECSTTSMVNMSAFLEGFRSALERGHDVLYVGISHAVSGTFHAAEMAAAELRETWGERRIELVDSLGTALGEGMVALRAAELRDEGLDTAEAGARLRELVGELNQLLTVSDLKYLRRTGRLSGSAALIGGALNVRAVLAGSRGGECVVTGRARGARRALELMADRWKERAADPGERVYIIHADNGNDARRLLELLRERGFAGECRTEVCEYVTGTHVGPDTVGLFFRGHERE